MPRRRQARPLTKAQRRRGLGVLIDGLTSELKERQQLLIELQQQHLQLRSSHDILVGYCDALEFGLQLERARQRSSAHSCSNIDTAAGVEPGTACQGQQNSLAGTSPAEQQLLAELAQLHYSALPLYSQQELAKQQQQQQDGKAEDAPTCRKVSAQSSSSSFATYHRQEVKVEDRMSPAEDQFLLFRWLLAQPLWPEAEHMTAAGLLSDYKQTLDASAVLLQQLGEPVPTHHHPNLQHWDLQQLQLQLWEPQAAAEQQSDLLQQLEQLLQLQQPQQPAKQQQADQQLNCAELQLRVEHDTAQMHQQSKQLQQGLVLQGAPQAVCMQQQQQQRLLNSLLQVLQNMFLHNLSMVRAGRGHMVSQLCMTNLQTGELMKEVDLSHFRASVRRAGLSQQQMQDISQAQSVFQSIHAPILQEMRQLQRDLGLDELPASSSMLSHLTRCNNQSAQLDRLLLLQNKGSMLRNCFAYHVSGCMSAVQFGRLSLLLWPYPALVPAVAQAVSELYAEVRMQDVALHRQQQQWLPSEAWAVRGLSSDAIEQELPASGITGLGIEYDTTAGI